MFVDLMNWSELEFSNLPWRKRRSFYGTLVSEIMLQQTTVQTVLNHFDRFMDLFPDISSLASSTEEEVVMAWKGLGYYRRARNLRNAAIEIDSFYDGQIPTDTKKLLEIKGIGDYTASALRSIGDNQVDLAIDANIERVFSRIFFLKSLKGKHLQEEIKSGFLKEIFFQLNSIKSYRAFNESLMDLGRTFCKANKVLCEECPVSQHCRGFLEGEPLFFPKKMKVEKKTKTLSNLHLLRVLVRKENKVLAYKKGTKEWLSGQYELPTWVISGEDNGLKQYPSLDTYLANMTDLTDVKNSKAFKSFITRYSIKNTIVKMEREEFYKIFFKDSRFFEFIDDDFDKNNFAVSVKKIFKEYQI